MNILIACEESQEVCKAFREKGHRAFSCDIQDCSGGHPEWHIKGDVLPLLNGNCTFETTDTHTHTQADRWDLIIAHPPCTYLSNAGACRLYKRFDGKQYVEWERYKKGLKAKEFFLNCLNADCSKIAVENPIPSGVYELPQYSQTIEPFYFGEPYSKKTCLWLKGLPLLMATEIVIPEQPWVSAGSKKADGTPRERIGKQVNQKARSKTFTGIAKAMAEQWG